MTPEKAGKEDWFSKLDAELERKTMAVSRDRDELHMQKTRVNKMLIEDLWNIMNRFGKIGVNMIMEPTYSSFMSFEKDTYPEKYTLRSDVDYEVVNNLQLIDRSQVQGRMGDSLKIWHYMADASPRVRVVFDYCEGEHYYKYAGWKRIFGQFVVYDAALSDADGDRIHEVLRDVVLAWYESHLRNNRDILINHLKENYEKGETFTE
ncbi:MAG: hypothetical protein A4E32_00362 [Methanomassiliicoccales archaeon PtaU1.Bin124]|nr:MAG: hypothetical protein A4E32_00362 [Methanomassiliicoccales archaeon PtaU1.Bin124]